MRDSAPKNQHDKKKLPPQIVVEANRSERETDHKLAKANGTNRTYLNDARKVCAWVMTGYKYCRIRQWL
jgi:3'-phosphoadenosine 5'-phosphosulfate (PAPS) 3'-phosphatase